MSAGIPKHVRIDAHNGLLQVDGVEFPCCITKDGLNIRQIDKDLVEVNLTMYAETETATYGLTMYAETATATYGLTPHEKQPNPRC